MPKNIVIITIVIIALAGVVVVASKNLIHGSQMKYSREELTAIAEKEAKKCQVPTTACLQVGTRVPLPGLFRFYTCSSSCVSCCAANDFLEGDIDANTYQYLLDYLSKKSREAQRFQECVDSKVSKTPVSVISGGPLDKAIEKAKSECRLRTLLPF